METNDCILLKRSEYEELKAKANSAKPDTISVRYDFIINGYYNSSPNIGGNINLSGGLTNQIMRIIKNIHKETISIIVEDNNNTKNILINRFKNLSLKDRIFFKGDKI